MPYHDRPSDEKNFYLFEYREVIADEHFHSSPEFVFWEEGEILVTINGEKRLVRAGEACFSAGFTIHSYQRASATNKGYVLIVPKKYADRMFNIFKQKNPPPFFKFSDYGLLEFLFSLCNKPYKKAEHQQGVFESAIQILYNAIADKYNFVERQKDSHDYLVSEILNYAADNFNKSLTLDVLSKKFGYARETLSRMLHKFLGESWNSYVNRLRVYRAQRMMHENPTLSILEIAFECGFNSSNTFYRAYAREFGYSPRTTPGFYGTPPPRKNSEHDNHSPLEI